MGKVYTIQTANADGTLPYEKDVDSFEEAVATAVWGTYGKSGDQPLKFVKLCECTTDHLNAIIRTQARIDPLYIKIIQHVLDKRKNPLGDELFELD